MISTEHCLICKGGRKNKCLYWHKDEETGDIWCFCTGKCQRGYSLRQYVYLAGISLSEFLKGTFNFKEASPNEVQVMSWPARFIPLSDPRAEKGVEYLKDRGLNLDCDLYYDLEREGIVFPYYFDNHFCGAQIRFIESKINKDGDVQKMDTLPGTRISMLFGLWNQAKFFTNVKVVGVCEGYFNALALQQAFNIKYGGVANNPFKFICTSGCNPSRHHQDVLRELLGQGIKVVASFDADEPGLKGIAKMVKSGCVSHISTTQDTELDWNDMLKLHGHDAIAEMFLKNITKVEG